MTHNDAKSDKEDVDEEKMLLASAAFRIFLLLELAAFRPEAQSSGRKASGDRAGRERRGVGHS
jgi:hypothetical protein